MDTTKKLAIAIAVVIVAVAVSAVVFVFAEEVTTEPEQPTIELEMARAECEARDGRTELLAYAGTVFDCFTVTVQSDGWRTCVHSVPTMPVRAEVSYNPKYFPCGEPDSEWAFTIDPVPSGCDAAVDWYIAYARTISDTMRDTMLQTDVVEVQARLWSLGHLFEQNNRRADATMSECGGDLGAALAISETSDGFNEDYRTIIAGCVSDGIHDCTALTPIRKTACERHPDREYLITERTLDNWVPSVGNRSGCTNRDGVSFSAPTCPGGIGCLPST